VNKGKLRTRATTLFVALCLAGIGAAIIGTRVGTVGTEAATVRQPSLTLKVSVNNKRATALVGTPLWIDARLVNEDAIRTFNQNQQRQAEGSETLEIPTVRIGTPDSPWIDLLQFKLVHVPSWDAGGERAEVLANIDWKILIPSFSRKRAQVEELSMEAIRVSWVVPPKISSRLSAGRYELTAIFDTRATTHADIPRVLLTSKPAYFDLRPPANQRDQAAVVLAEASYVASYDQDFGRAVALARSAEELDPQNMEVHLTLGAIFRVQHQWKEAIEEYTTYLGYIQGTYLSPTEDRRVEYLEHLLNWMREQLQEERDGTQ